jgi:hypothetical protein
VVACSGASVVNTVPLQWPVGVLVTMAARAIPYAECKGPRASAASLRPLRDRGAVGLGAGATARCGAAFDFDALRSAACPVTPRRQMWQDAAGGARRPGGLPRRRSADHDGDGGRQPRTVARCSGGFRERNVDWLTTRSRILRPSRTRAVFLLIAVGAFAVTEFGRHVYRPWAYRRALADFGLADSVGNLGGIIV